MGDASTPTGAAAAKSRANTSRYKRGALRWWVLALLFAFLAFMLAPIFLALNNAVKTAADYATHGPLALPQSFTIEGLLGFWNYVDFTKKIWNSLLLSGCAAFFGVALSVLNAYAIGIGRIRGGRMMLVILLLGIMIPQESLVYPLYYMSKAAGLYDSLWAVIIIFTVLQSIFGTYLLAAVMTTFPREILEAARVDGASRWQVLWYVVIPILRPTDGGSCDLLFHLDLERVPDPVGDPGLEHQPDRLGRHGCLERTICLAADDHGRRRTSGHHPDGDLLPDLPAHLDEGRGCRRCEMSFPPGRASVAATARASAAAASGRGRIRQPRSGPAMRWGSR